LFGAVHPITIPDDADGSHEKPWKELGTGAEPDRQR
jgi:hypothetical protein